MKIPREKAKLALRKQFDSVTDPQGYVDWPQDDLIPGVRLDQFEADLRRGDGNELRMKFCAVHSSAALAVNCFAPFKDRPGNIESLGHRGAVGIAFEKRLKIFPERRLFNLDVWIDLGGGAIAIESKMLEYFQPKVPEFAPAYGNLAPPSLFNGSLRVRGRDPIFRTRRFERYIGVDYSGAKTPSSSLKGLRVFEADGVGLPHEVLPLPSNRKYWTRRGLAEWITRRLSEDVATIVGIDHAFSFPMRYFDQHLLRRDWRLFLNDFCDHWPTDEDNTCVEVVRDGVCGRGAARSGNSKWRRVTDVRAGSAKSVFHFDVQGSVAKSTHAGIPWLRFISANAARPVHFWPFDGWHIPPGISAVVEVYPRLWSKDFPAEERSPDQHDAYAVAAWMQRADGSQELGECFAPDLTDSERSTAKFEGWILGVRK